jgi:hypothetical protein
MKTPSAAPISASPDFAAIVADPSLDHLAVTMSPAIEQEFAGKVALGSLDGLHRTMQEANVRKKRLSDGPLHLADWGEEVVLPEATPDAPEPVVVRLMKALPGETAEERITRSALNKIASEEQQRKMPRIAKLRAVVGAVACAATLGVFMAAHDGDPTHIGAWAGMGAAVGALSVLFKRSPTPPTIQDARRVHADGNPMVRLISP